MMRFLFLIFGLSLSSFATPACNALELDQNLPTKNFKHTRNSILSMLADYHHTASDTLTVVNSQALVEVKFSYGALRKDLFDEDIELWIDTCSNSLTKLGIFRTDSDGRIKVALDTKTLQLSGAFKIWARVTGDNSFTTLILRVMTPGTELVVFDIDGTLTYSNTDSSVRPGAVNTTHAIRDSGFEVLYLSGRHYVLTNITKRLLRDNQFAPGTLVVGQSISDIWPSNGHVGEFKLKYLNYLRSLGIKIKQAYGNAESDIYAYLSAKIPTQNIYIMGEYGGQKDTQALGEDFLSHLGLLVAVRD
ncbi:MAG: hypothetical protein JKY15_01145 [Deltaproteobacteria bacterium]|nr:hypothetical protein [Deltaproteobacteria bacterium]